jgi:hypothetical protein
VLWLFRQEPTSRQVWLYGSRAKGTNRPGANVGLTLIGEQVTRKTVSYIRGVLDDESPIPYFFDVIHWDTIANKKPKEELQQTGQLIYQRSE